MKYAMDYEKKIENKHQTSCFDLITFERGPVLIPFQIS